MKHQGTKLLVSDRLILRRFVMEDAQAMYNNWASDSEVTRFLMWPAHENVEASKEILSEWTSKYCEDTFYLWAITVKENGECPIGSISVIDNNDRIKMMHIGYCIGKQWWNQGIMSEAFGLIISYLFNEVQVNRIEARHDPRNQASGKVMIKCGLQYEGMQKEADWNNQGICDVSLYAILAKDYHAENKKKSYSEP